MKEIKLSEITKPGTKAEAEEFRDLLIEIGNALEGAEEMAERFWNKEYSTNRIRDWSGLSGSFIRRAVYLQNTIKRIPSLDDTGM